MTAPRRTAAPRGLALAALALLAPAALAQQTPPRPAAPMPMGMPGASMMDDEVHPAPASIGTDVPLTYFGPAPSQVQRELIGPYQLLKSGHLDEEAGTITLPLYRGRMRSGETVWYIVTDTDDRGNAEGLGINYSAKLTYASTGRAVRTAHMDEHAMLVFDSGTVDFRPERRLTPGEAPNLFPPRTFQPGAVGDRNYSPLVRIENAGGHIYNAPIVAFGTDADALDRFCGGNADHAVTHDKVTAICPRERTVTMELTAGFSFARPVLYLSTEANHPLVATLEGATLAPGLEDVPVGADDSFLSAVERLFTIANGPTGADNPQRQGLNSAIADGTGPLNVLGGIPTVATDYSPLWDVNAGVWTQDAIARGYRSRVTEEFQILGLVQRGFLTGMDGKPFGSTGFIVNCPIVTRFL